MVLLTCKSLNNQPIVTKVIFVNNLKGMAFFNFMEVQLLGAKTKVGYVGSIKTLELIWEIDSPNVTFKIKWYVFLMCSWHWNIEVLLRSPLICQSIQVCSSVGKISNFHLWQVSHSLTCLVTILLRFFFSNRSVSWHFFMKISYSQSFQLWRSHGCAAIYLALRRILFPTKTLTL